MAEGVSVPSREAPVEGRGLAVTIETAMVFALGFLVAALASLALMGAVWRRAVRLTTRRVESAVPLSMAEIKADKDQLRAEHALALRRLEIEAEKLRGKVNDQTADLARRTEAIRDLNAELDGRAARILSLEGVQARLEEELRGSQANVADRLEDLRKGAETLTDKEAAYEALAKDHAAKVVESDGQRVEIVALRTQVDNQRNQIGQLTEDLAGAEADLVGHRQSFAETSNLLTAERQRMGDIQGKLNAETELTATLQRELAEMRKSLAETAILLSGERNRASEQQAELKDLQGKLTVMTRRAEGLDAEVAGLKAKLAEEAEKAARERQARDTAERSVAGIEAERDRLKGEIANMKASNAETSRALQIAAETAKAEKNVLEGSLAQARDDRLRIQREIAALTRSAEAATARELRETTGLRSRIDEIAVEMARVTALLEGPGSRIDQILADQAANDGAGGKRRGELSLADRIRALLDAARNNQAAE
jgi:chromosome segregation ATPase